MDKSNKRKVLIMGVINLTKDSFYSGSRFKDLDEIDQVLRTMKDADIIDLGAESSRPGANQISVQRELEILLPVVEWVKTKHPQITLSIDTCKSEVAEKCIELGVDMINDISAGENSNGDMFSLCAESGTMLVLMHKKGSPKTMQIDPTYEDVVKEVYSYLSDRVKIAIKNGCLKNKLIIDVGIGFGKKFEHNLALLHALPKFKEIGVDVLVGVSRKSMIGEITGKPIMERLEGTLGVHLASAFLGADILRVHDVAETKDALDGFFTVL